MTDALVVDASVAMKWVVTEPDSAIAEDLLAQVRTFHAPSLMHTELANGLWKAWRRKSIGEDQARAALGSIGRIIGRWHGVSGLLPDALEWSMTYDHPVCDFCYLALARQIGARVVTADERLMRLIAGTSLDPLLIPLRNAA